MENNRLIDIIEDHQRIIDVLSHVTIAIRTGRGFPEYLPCLNDASVTDMLSCVIVELNKARG